MDELFTRVTLLARLRDGEDMSSWAEFVEIYTPLMHAWCRKRDLKAEDTADIVQEVLRSVSLAMRGFEYDPSKGRFRGWLFTILRNTAFTHLKKSMRRPVTASDTTFLQVLESTPDENEESDWEHDYRMRLLNWAMEKIRPEFSERIWELFTESALKERRHAEVAEDYGISANAVALAKSRVVRRLREKIEAIDPERWELEMAAQEENS